jgi:hypothetical protein
MHIPHTRYTEPVSIREALEAKRRVYPYVGGVRTDGSVYEMMPMFGPALRLDDDGLVHDVDDGHCLGHWYVYIEKKGYAASWLVRRDKLNDVCTIEALRWRILLELRNKALPAYNEIAERGKVLGRIYLKERDQFVEWNSQGGKDTCSPREWAKRKGNAARKSVVDRLVSVPLPAEIEAGDDYTAAEERISLLHRRIEFVEEALSSALMIDQRAPKHGYDGRFRGPHDLLYRARINGRIYVQLVASGGGGIKRVWPTPEDVELDFDA